MPSSATDTAQLFGRRLQRLVDVVYPEGRQRYTDAEIAAHVGVTAQYISKLRSGKSVPSVEKAQSLADFFAVEHVDYFLKGDDDPVVLAVERRLDAQGEPRTDDQLWDELRKDHGVKEIAMRAGQLSPEARAAVLGIVNQLFRSEKGAAPAPRSPETGPESAQRADSKDV